MLLQMHVSFFRFVFNSWYLLMFLSISILTTISLFIWTLVVTSFIVSNRHRHYTLTAGSVVLHIIIVVVVITSFLYFFSINISMVTNIYKRDSLRTGSVLTMRAAFLKSISATVRSISSMAVVVLSLLWDTQPV